MHAEQLATPANPPATPKSKPRWYQFSLRSLFILTFLVAIASSWFAVKMGQATKQKEAVEALVKLGGTVYYDYEVSSSGLSLVGTETTASVWLRKMLGNDFFGNAISFCNPPPKLTDVDLKYLARLKQLKHLDLQGTQVTDSGLEQLKGLSQLLQLNVKGTKVTDAGLEHIEELENLQFIHLAGTQISDAGLEHLENLKHLTFLYLSQTAITNAGLEHLNGLKHLSILELTGTKVTDDGVAKLQKALPNCKIVTF
jgi:hypothetical protein